MENTKNITEITENTEISGNTINSRVAEIVNMDEIIHLQPTINVGMIGSVSNGKSSITEKLTEVKTQKHSKEREQNITIKLGYANFKIFKCGSCPKPKCYQSRNSYIMTCKCKYCDSVMELVKHISALDNPGHNGLMTTMLNSTSIIDTTILVESASNKEPAQQTKEHLYALKMTNLHSDIVCLNKVDLIKKENAFAKIDVLSRFLKGTNAENAPIIPIAANYGLNIDVLCEYICELIKEPKRNLDKTLKMIIVRSFNINKPNTTIDKLDGGIIGGSIVQGVAKLEDEIIILPGVIKKYSGNGNKISWQYTPLIGKILSINSEKNNLIYAISGGLIGLKLDIDPGYCTNDGLVGNVVTHSNNADEYKIYETLYVKFDLVNSDNVGKFGEGDILILNSNACNGKCVIEKLRNAKAILKLIDSPICVKNGDYITLSKSIGNSMVIAGRCEIIKGDESAIC